MTTKEFNVIVKNAKSEFNGLFKNPFVIVNILNKFVNGDFEKMADVDGISHENAKKVAKVLSGLHDGKKPFDVRLLTKQNGVFCRIVTQKQCPIYGFDLLSVSPKGWRCYAQIPLTINAYFAEFARIAKVDVANTEKAEKAAKRAAEKAARAKESEAQKATRKAKKAREAKVKELSLQLMAGDITPEHFAEQIAILKNEAA